MADDYLPKDEPGLDEWFQNWATKTAESGASHGFTATELEQMRDDAKVVHDVVSGSATVETNRREFTGFKRIMLYGAKNATTPAFPVQTSVVPTALEGSMAAGIIKRTRSFVRRLKESANYTEAVGADYRVLPIQKQGIVPEEAKPKLTAQAMADSQVDIYFTRGEFDGIELERQIGDSTAWTSIGRFYKSPADDDAPPAAPNTPEVRRYRARFLKGNKPVGINSDIVSAVTIP